MIFVILGSQKYQFNRLLQKIDEMIQSGSITDKVIAQSGYSTYKPKNYVSKDFFKRAEFIEHIRKSDIIITHGGTGAIVTALKEEKKVIGVARKKAFGEHVDDHQEEIVSAFDRMGLILEAKNLDDLDSIIKKIEKKDLSRFESGNKMFLKSLKDDLRELGEQYGE